MSIHPFRRRTRPAPRHAGGPFPPEKQWQPGTLQALAGQDSRPAWYQDAPAARPVRSPMRRAASPAGGQVPPGPVPPGMHPYVARPYPVPGMPVSSARRRGSRHTEAWTPDFAQQGALTRPYVPGNAFHSRPPAPDTWHRKAHPLTQQGRSADEFVRERMRALAYPPPGAAPVEVARFMRRVSVITGTRSTLEQSGQCTAWARPAAPGADIAVLPRPSARPAAPTRPQIALPGGRVFTRRAA